MKTELYYEKTLVDISNALQRLPYGVENNEKEFLQRVGKTVKDNIKKFMVVSNVEEEAKKIQPSNYDGSRPYIHMKDDIGYSVKKDKQGRQYVTVKGGKFTGYKWHMVNDGTHNKDGSVHTKPTHFIDNGMNLAESDIEAEIDRLMEKVGFE